MSANKAIKLHELRAMPPEQARAILLGRQSLKHAADRPRRKARTHRFPADEMTAPRERVQVGFSDEMWTP